MTTHFFHSDTSQLSLYEQKLHEIIISANNCMYCFFLFHKCLVEHFNIQESLT